MIPFDRVPAKLPPPRLPHVVGTTQDQRADVRCVARNGREILREKTVWGTAEVEIGERWIAKGGRRITDEGGLRYPRDVPSLSVEN